MARRLFRLARADRAILAHYPPSLVVLETGSPRTNSAGHSLFYLQFFTSLLDKFDDIRVKKLAGVSGSEDPTPEREEQYAEHQRDDHLLRSGGSP
jgi:hypothetical protein